MVKVEKIIKIVKIEIEVVLKKEQTTNGLENKMRCGCNRTNQERKSRRKTTKLNSTST